MVKEMHLQENTSFDLWRWPLPQSQGHTKFAQFPLHYVIYSPAKFPGATFNGLGWDAFTRNLTEGQTDGRQTDFVKKFIIPFFLKKKGGYNKQIWFKLNSEFCF